MSLGAEDGHVAEAKLTISSKNYSSWSLRGWLMCKFSGLDFDEIGDPADEPEHAGRAAASVTLDAGAGSAARRTW